MASRESDVIVRNLKHSEQFLNAQRTVLKSSLLRVAVKEHRDLRSGMPPEPSGRDFRPRIGSNKLVEG